MEISDVGRNIMIMKKELIESTVFDISASWICSWVHSCLEVATFESQVAELKPCLPDLEMYISEQLQTHAVTAAWVNQPKSLFHCTEWVD